MAMKIVICVMAFVAFADAAREQILTDELEVESASSSLCRPLMSRSVCLPVTNNIVENLMGHDASNLNCLKTYCEDQGKQNCCETLEGLKTALAGHTASSLFISEEKFEKLLAAVGSVAAVAESKPSLDIYSEPKKQNMTKQDEEEASVSIQDGLNASGDGLPGKCLCPIGTRSVNLAGLGEYEKSNWQLQGVGGGKCTGSCDTCMRVHNGDRLPCCVMLGPMKPGRCGKEIKGADFKGQKCLCGGLHKFKEELSKKNPNCLPDTPCSKCGYNCA